MLRVFTNLLIIFSGILVFLISSVIWFITPAFSPSIEGWDGYYALLVDAGAELGDVQDRLEPRFPGIVSALSTHLSVHNFRELERVPVAAMDGRLDPADLRWDPYLRGVRDYFILEQEGSRYHVLYLPSDESAFEVSREVGVALAGTDFTWDLPRWRQDSGWYMLGVFGLVAILQVIMAGGVRGPAILAAIPFLGAVYTGSLHFTIAAGFVYVLYVFLLRDLVPFLRHRITYPDHKEGIGRVLLRLIVTVLGIVGMIFAASGTSLARDLAMSLVVVLPAAAIPVAIRLFFVRLKRLRREHRGFVPMQMNAAGAGASFRDGFVVVVPAVALLVLFPLVLFRIFPEGEGISIPTPLAIPGLDELTLPDLRRAMGAGELPALPEYLAHRRFQTTIMQGGEYSFPRRGERFEVSRYELVDNNLERRMELVARFDDTWLAQQLSEASLLEAMLLSQGAPKRVVLRPIPGLYFIQSHLFRQNTLMLVLSAPFLISTVQYSLYKRSGVRRRLVGKKGHSL